MKGKLNAVSYLSGLPLTELLTVVWTIASSYLFIVEGDLLEQISKGQLETIPIGMQSNSSSVSASGCSKDCSGVDSEVKPQVCLLHAHIVCSIV